MELDDEASREEAVGRLLREARGSMSQREAAKRAGFSATQWRHMENGVRDNGVRVRASDRAIEAAARAVGLDPAFVFEAAGREYQPAADAVHLSASGVDLEELRRLDPEAYDLILRQAELALDRARDRREA